MSDEGFFFGDQEFAMVEQFNREFVRDVVNVPVQIFSVDPDVSNVTFRGETPPNGKQFKDPIEVHSLVIPEETTRNLTQTPDDVQRSATFGFERGVLKRLDFYPQPGDVISWDDTFFEVQNVKDNDLISGRPQYCHAIVCETQSVRKSNLNIQNPAA